MSLHQLLEKVEDEQSFLRFSRALRLDRIEAVQTEKLVGSSPYGPDAGGWENTSIEDFLGAAIAWAEDTSFGRSQIPGDNPWKRFAAFLYLGKIYE